VSGVAFAETLPLPTASQQLESVYDCSRTLGQEEQIGMIPTECRSYATISLDGVKLFVLQLNESGDILEDNGKLVAKLPESQQFLEVATEQITPDSKQSRTRAIVSSIFGILMGSFAGGAAYAYDLRHQDRQSYSSVSQMK